MEKIEIKIKLTNMRYIYMYNEFFICIINYDIEKEKI